MKTRSIVQEFVHVTAVALAVFACGCGDSETLPASTAVSYPLTPRTTFGGERPVELQVPSSYSADQPTPLVLILHGFGADGFFQSGYFKLARLVESEHFLLAAPNGTVNTAGTRFWNATAACCDFEESGVDDVAYLRGLIQDIKRDYNVDRRRVYLVGHSNGGFMAHRMACENAGEIAAIVSLAGATFLDPATCRPSEPVSVLDIHGDADQTIRYDGANNGANGYPSALETVARWVSHDRCTMAESVDAAFNLDVRLAENETDRVRYVGCARSTNVELWTIRGGAHIPNLSRDFAPLVWQWLKEHPKS